MESSKLKPTWNGLPAPSKTVATRHKQRYFNKHIVPRNAYPANGPVRPKQNVLSHPGAAFFLETEGPSLGCASNLTASAHAGQPVQEKSNNSISNAGITKSSNQTKQNIVSRQKPRSNSFINVEKTNAYLECALFKDPLLYLDLGKTSKRRNNTYTTTVRHNKLKTKNEANRVSEMAKSFQPLETLKSAGGFIYESKLIDKPSAVTTAVPNTSQPTLDNNEEEEEDVLQTFCDMTSAILLDAPIIDEIEGEEALSYGPPPGLSPIPEDEVVINESSTSDDIIHTTNSDQETSDSVNGESLNELTKPTDSTFPKVPPQIGRRKKNKSALVWQPTPPPPYQSIILADYNKVENIGKYYKKLLTNYISTASILSGNNILLVSNSYEKDALGINVEWKFVSETISQWNKIKKEFH